MSKSIAWKKEKTKTPLGVFVLSYCQRISLLFQMDLCLSNGYKSENYNHKSKVRNNVVNFYLWFCFTFFGQDDGGKGQMWREEGGRRRWRFILREWNLKPYSIFTLHKWSNNRQVYVSYLYLLGLLVGIATDIQYISFSGRWDQPLIVKRDA